MIVKNTGGDVKTVGKGSENLFVRKVVYQFQMKGIQG